MSIVEVLPCIVEESEGQMDVYYVAAVFDKTGYVSKTQRMVTLNRPKEAIGLLEDIAERLGYGRVVQIGDTDRYRLIFTGTDFERFRMDVGRLMLHAAKRERLRLKKRQRKSQNRIPR